MEQVFKNWVVCLADSECASGLMEVFRPCGVPSDDEVDALVNISEGLLFAAPALHASDVRQLCAAASVGSQQLLSASTSEGPKAKPPGAPDRVKIAVQSPIGAAAVGGVELQPLHLIPLCIGCEFG